MRDPRHGFVSRLKLALGGLALGLAITASACGKTKAQNGGTGGIGIGGAAGVAGAGGGAGGAPVDSESVLTRNKTSKRDGSYIQPTITKAIAATMALDASFHPLIDGNVYAQPLYVAAGPGGQGIFIVVTENNAVHALAEATGAEVWTAHVGSPAQATGAGCGNISPLGITGTPVVDLASRTLFLDAAVGNSTTILRHEIHALSIDDGEERPGFPFDPTGMTSNGATFTARLQNQRAALLLVNGILYVPYSGHGGDCGSYHGWVISVPIANPAGASAFATTAVGGGIWGVGGLASDGTDVFAVTGNTFGVAADSWSHGEAVLRLRDGATFSSQTADYFTPSNWLQLDHADADLGGSGAVLIDIPGATPSALAVALGKNGVVYLLDRTNLGGIGTGNGTTGEGLVSASVASGAICNAAASYRTAAGSYLVFHVHGGGRGVGCPTGQDGDLVALKLGSSRPLSIAVAWCADSQGLGSPMVTTTDGTANAVVWTAGAENSQRLHGFDGDTGAPVFAGGVTTDLMPNQVRRFNTAIAVRGRILVGADNALYAFKPR